MSRIMMGQWLRWGTRMPSVQRRPPGVVTYRMAKERPSQRVIELSPGSTTPGSQGRMEVRPPA